MAEERVKARKKQKKERDVSRLGEPLLRAKIFVASRQIDNVAKKKEVALFQDRLGLPQTLKNGHDKKLLEKVWVFAAHHRLEAVKEKFFDTIEPGKTRVLSALTANRHITRTLFTFSIKSQFGDNPQKLKTEKLILAFETRNEAQMWLEAVADRIAVMRRKQKPSLEIGASHGPIQAQSSEDGTEATESPSPRPQTEASFPSDARSTPRNGRNAPSADTDAETDGTMATPRGDMGSILDDDEDRASLEMRTSSLDNLHAELRADSRVGADFHNWTVVRTSNNITVLRGIGEHNAKSIMLSYIVGAPPRLCVKTVLKRDHQDIQMANTTVRTEVVEAVDPCNDRLRVTWSPIGVAGLFLLPRTLTAQRLWRREDDGTYVLVFKACEHNRPEQTVLGRFLAPAIKLDTVMTFSPLTPEFCPYGESAETLVTVTADLGKFRGMWHVRSPLEWLMKIFYPFPFSHVSAYIDAIVEENVAVRTKAESSKFSIKPFLISQHSGTQRYEALNSIRQAPMSPLAKTPSIPPTIPTPAPTPDPPQVAEQDFDDVLPPVSSFASAAEAEDEPQTDDSSTPFSGTQRQDGDNRNGNGVAAAVETNVQKPAEPTQTTQEAATCDRKYWSCPGHNNIKVRGKNYLTDRKKIPAEEPVFELAACDLLQVKEPTPHIAPFLPSFKVSKAPFTFIMQIMFGNPSLSLTFSWAAPDPASQQHLSRKLTKALETEDITSDWSADEDDLLDKPFELTLARFLAGSTSDEAANKRRDGVVKLVPNIAKGSWFYQRAVGSTPCLLGHKLKAHYHRGPGYFEVDVDVSSSSVAANIVGLVQNVTKSLWVDMAIVLEGHSIEELPEVLLGSVRCAHLDLQSAKLLDTTTGEITDKPSQ